MIRLDKACDLSAFTDKESSRYCLSAVRFRPPNRDEVAKHYRELRKPREKTRAVRKHKSRAISYGREYTHREYVGIRMLTASEAYAQARAMVPAEVEATNGKLLVRIPTLNGDAFPNTPGSGKEPKECLIHGDHLKAAIRRIPKCKTKPVLESVRLTQSNDNNAILSTTDCERSVDETVRQVDGRYPRTDDVWPKAAPTVTVTLDAALLASIVQHAKTHANSDARGIDVIIRDSDTAVEFHYSLPEGRTAKAILMPLARK